MQHLGEGSVLRVELVAVLMWAVKRRISQNHTTVKISGWALAWKWALAWDSVVLELHNCLSLLRLG